MARFHHTCYHKDFSSVSAESSMVQLCGVFLFLCRSTTILFLRLKKPFFFFQTSFSGGIFYMWNNFPEEMCPPHPETCTGKQVQPTFTGCSKSPCDLDCSRQPLCVQLVHNSAHWCKIIHIEAKMKATCDNERLTEETAIMRKLGGWHEHRHWVWGWRVTGIFEHVNKSD